MHSGAAQRPPALRYGAAVGIVAFACAFREALTPLWGSTAVPFIFFWPAVVLATGYGRLGPGLLALILSALAADWFFIEPRYALLPRTLADLLALAVFVGAGFSLVWAVEGMHRSEEKLRESERKFAAMFRSLPIAAVIQELPEARFVEVNDAFVRMSGYSREEMLGKTSLEIGMVSDPEERRRRMDRFFRDGYVRDLRARVTTKAGEILEVLVNAERVELQGKKYVLSSARDVTRETRAREEIERLNADLDRRVRERTADLEAFTYSVAHDLRAPLRAMHGFAEAVLEDAGARLEAGEKDGLRRIREAAGRMDALVQGLLAYSRLGRVDLPCEPVDLRAAAGNALGMLAAELKEKNAQVVVEEEIPPVLGHPLTVLQVLLNLISNGVKFVAPGVAPRVRIAAQTRPGWVRLLVQDNGIGIAPPYRERIFRVFERLNPAEAYPGAGVGLAIVKRAIERMGGRVGVDSEEGRGSTFWFELTEAPSPPAERPGTAGRGGPHS